MITTSTRPAAVYAAHLIAALALVACGSSGGHQTDAGHDDPADPAIERYLDGVIPDGASGTLAAARDGQLVHCRGFGTADHEAKVAATCDTVYDVGSMTKQFTAAAILKLEMLGRLELAEPIGEYLGPVPADKRDITVHQLLTHTSGLVDALGGDYERLTRSALLAAAFQSELLAAPGSEYHYSNVGYSLLAAIVEQASGLEYEEFLAKQLFAPAGMRHTGYLLPNWNTDDVAVEYDPNGRPQGRPYEHPWAADGPYWNLRGNGGMLSTARDIFRWHLALQRDEILDRSAKAKLFTPYVREAPGGDSYYGYGWVILDSEYGRVAWHNGGNGWSYGELTRLLERGEMVFWIVNQYKDTAAGWSFGRLGQKLTQGIVERI